MSTEVAELEEAFLRHLQTLEIALKLEYPEYKFNVWSSSTGSLTEYQGHDVGIECLFPDAAPHEADNVFLMVGVKHLTTVPLLCDASVGSGVGASPSEAVDLISTPVPFSSAALRSVTERFPELIEAFENAIRVWRSRHAAA